MKKNKGLFLCVSLTLLLTACSHYDYNHFKNEVYGPHGYVHPKQPAYLAEKEVPPLKIPANLSDSTIQPLYAVPSAPAVKVKQTKIEHSELVLPPDSLAGKSQAYDLDQQGHVVKQTVATKKGKPNFIYTREDGKVMLVVNQPKLAVWQWLGDALPRAGLRIIGRDESTLTYQVKDATGMFGNSLHTVHLEALSDKQSEIWITSDFGSGFSHSQIGFYFNQLLSKLEASH